MPHRSAAEAREILREFLSVQSQKESIDIGDESYAWGYSPGRVPLRKGKFTIYIDSYFDVDSDPDTMKLSQAEKIERDEAERKRLSRVFAKHAVDALDSP